MDTLFFYKHRYQFRAEDGAPGGKRRCHGKNGSDLVLKVPEGTILREEKSGKVVADMSGSNTRQVILRGGRGGRGNMNFATPTNQAPQYAEPGKPAMELYATLELKLVADVGLVGFPNAGKSTFLSRVTNADPKIANYPFTTIDPNLGVVDLGDGRGFVLADMPGLIEGASEGAGLGHRFLRHIERTRVLIHLVDTASFDGRDPVEDIIAIHRELEAFNPDIMKKPILIAPNKIDVVDTYDGMDAYFENGDDSGQDNYTENGDGTEQKKDPLTRIKEYCEENGYPVYPISAVSGEGVRELLLEVRKLLDTTAPKQVYYEQEYDPQDQIASSDLPYSITVETGRSGETQYVVEGPKIDRMLSYTNLDSEKGFRYFTQFLRKSGIIAELKEKGIEEGMSVRMYGHVFDFYDDEVGGDDSDK
jgi:GTP-binding protein